MADDNFDMEEYDTTYRRNPPRTRRKHKFYEELYENAVSMKGNIPDDKLEITTARNEEVTRSHRKQTTPARVKLSGTNYSGARQQAFMQPSGSGTIERRMAQSNALKLRNVLKLPKAHKWVFYEWFYSNIDRPLLLGENDFRNFIRENFPTLKTRRLTRSQWGLIRRMIGKPRRCSIPFFKEERAGLHSRRGKIRHLQQKRTVELDFLRDLPDDMVVPMPLIIGTRVTARVRFPTDGLYLGTVDAIDSHNNTYRISFEKTALQTRSVPDYEVLSIEPQETIPLSAYKTQHKASRNLFMSPARLLAQSALQGVRQHFQQSSSKSVSGLVSGGTSYSAPAATSGQQPSSFAHHQPGINGHSINPADCHLCMSKPPEDALEGVDPAALASVLNLPGSTLQNDSISAASKAAANRFLLNEADIYGGYPMKFLVMVTKLSKILEVKKRCVEELRDLNTAAERKIATQEPIALEFQHVYLNVIVNLERLNKELGQYLMHVLQYANEIAQEHGVPPLEQCGDFKNKCDDDAYEMVSRLKTVMGQRLRNSRNTELINKLISMLVQVRTLTENQGSDFEAASVHDSMNDLKSGLHAQNQLVAENSVEIQINHLLSELSTQSNINAFFYSHPKELQLG